MFNQLLRRSSALILVLALGCQIAVPQSGFAGGWGVTTVNAMPSVIVAGEKALFQVSVRQHGVRLMTEYGFLPKMRFTHRDGGSFSVTTRKGEKPGVYVAEVVFAKAGVWAWQMTSFPGAQMIDLDVVEPRHAIGARYRIARELRTVNGQRERGRTLFMSKGCYACHSHDAIRPSGEFRDAFGGGGAPDLSQPKWTAEYLRLWLSDPAGAKPQTTMPNLDLTSNEIEWLSAFLMHERDDSTLATR